MMANELLHKDICDLVGDVDGLDITCNTTIRESNCDSDYSAIYHSHVQTMEPIWRALQNAATLHLKGVVSNLVEEKQDSLHLQEMRHNGDLSTNLSNFLYTNNILNLRLI